MRDAVVTGKAEDIAHLLIGGHDSRKRLAIHQRHYETSLVNALVGKFPGTAWLIGAPFVTDAARRFVRKHPPGAPCIAEYGQSFPEFLSVGPTLRDRVPYLRAFAELEWHVGQAAIAVDQPAVTFEEFSSLESNAIAEMVLLLQPAVRYLQASWPIDELMKLFLAETAPDRFELAAFDVWLEVYGSRGEFHINRLDATEFIFRKIISDGGTIGDAVECALDAHPAFDPGQALVSLVVSGLVRGIAPGGQGELR
jgi:hypothetical protein